MPFRALTAAALLVLLCGGLPGAAAADPLAFTLRTIDNDAGVRVVIEFTRKPIYEVRGDGRRVYVTLREGETRPPFKRRDFSGALLEKVKISEGGRSSEIVFYTGPEFGTFSSFEMGEPFRLVLDLRRRPAPTQATRLGTPEPPPPAGSAGHAGGGAGTKTIAGIGGPPPQEPGKGAASAPPAGAKGAAAGQVGGPTGGPAGAPGESQAPEGATPHQKAAFTVVVDAGHGGTEDGARGPSGLLEKEVTLDVARRLRARLQGDSGTEVLLTRDDDRTVGLDERTAIANHARADLFVSIHANSSRRDSAHGSETYFLSYQATDDEARAVAAVENNALRLDDGVQGQTGLEMVLWDLAQSAYLKESSDLAEMIQDRLNDLLGVRNRGIKQAPFRVLMGATMPAVLVEVAFISSPEEEKRLREPAFKDSLAQAVAESVRRFREKFPR
jgi:N-acetylmuramoyl-L-alanine amidase